MDNIHKKKFILNEHFHHQNYYNFHHGNHHFHYQFELDSVIRAKMFFGSRKWDDLARLCEGGWGGSELNVQCPLK